MAQKKLEGQKQLDRLSPQELQDIGVMPDGPVKLRALREECFPRLAGAMKTSPALLAWAAQMKAMHGPKVQVHRCTLDWLSALAVVRYGEAPAHWPKAFGEKDGQRAIDWQAGKVPADVTYLVAKEG